MTAATRTRGYLLWSFLMPLVYIPWFLPMFALGYWVTSLVGAYPTTQDAPELTAMGLGGWLLALLYGLVSGWPSWLGVSLAVLARRHGADAWAFLALGINLAMAVLLLVSTLLPSA